jgi:hypothetical protein
MACLFPAQVDEEKVEEQGYSAIVKTNGETRYCRTMSGMKNAENDDNGSLNCAYHLRNRVNLI